VSPVEQTLTVEELLLGSEATHVVEIPPDVLRPAAAGEEHEQPPATVRIRPLVLADVQRIQRAARDERALTSVLMVQQALVEPQATVEQVSRMHAGLVEFLLREVNRVSGLSLSGDELEATVQAPLARACFVLAREFGWTPEECAGLTLGQILVYLELLGRGEGPSSVPE
jgi:hypothetical protein